MSVIAVTTVNRSSMPGESHGGLYLVDPEGQRGAHVLDWTRPSIDWMGHGGSRGLRGISFHGQSVFIAGSDELYVFTPDLELSEVHTSPYLGHAQAVASFEDRVYVASARYDSILAFDIESGVFDWGLQIIDDEGGLRGMPFDPQGALGPSPANRLHLNSLYCDPRGVFISGLRSMGLLHFDGQRINRLVTLPEGVRNARPWRDGVLFNDTEAGVVRFLTPESNRVFQVPVYPAEELEPEDFDDPSAARQGFARGLCVVNDHVFASGSSPLTVTLHDLDTMKTTLRVNLSTDLRQAVHTMALWPFSD